ncbi:MAG: hypothetical protein RLZZ262_326 [Bacteroidota bacterium]
MVDQNLIDNCIRRDRRAQNELYQLCYRKFISVCWRYSNSKEDAVELMNNGFLKIVTQLEKYNTEVPFEAWARKVIIHTIIDEYRKSKQYKKHIALNVEMKDLPLVEEEETHDQERLEKIMSKLHLLPPVTLRVFNLYAIDGYRHKEIAELLQISEGTAMWHYSEAKKRIRLLLSETKA